MGKTSMHLYALALGSNRALSARLSPPRLLEKAIGLIGGTGTILKAAPILTTPPMGPSRRHYANSAILVESPLPPQRMLRQLQSVERALGRRRAIRWGARRLDIDIILWSGGRWNSRSLHIPHPAFRERDFVLTPLHAIIADWRDPVSGLSIRHLHFRLRKPTPRG